MLVQELCFELCHVGMSVRSLAGSLNTEICVHKIAVRYLYVCACAHVMCMCSTKYSIQHWDISVM